MEAPARGRCWVYIQVTAVMLVLMRQEEARGREVGHKVAVWESQEHWGSQKAK